MAESISPEGSWVGSGRTFCLGWWGHPRTQDCGCLADPPRGSRPGLYLKHIRQTVAVLLDMDTAPFLLCSLSCSSIRNPKEEIGPIRRNNNSRTCQQSRKSGARSRNNTHAQQLLKVVCGTRFPSNLHVCVLSSCIAPDVCT